MSNEKECDKFNNDPHEIEGFSYSFFNGDGGSVTILQSFIYDLTSNSRDEMKEFFSFSQNDFREDYPMIKFIACDFCFFKKKKILCSPHFFMMMIIFVIIFSEWVELRRRR